MATLYFSMKQRVILDWESSVFFEDFYERCIQCFYSNTRNIPLSSIMSFVSQVNIGKQILLSFSGIEANGPHYVYNIRQKTSANICRETDVCIVFRESIFSSRMFFRNSDNNIGLGIIHKHTRFINVSFLENKKTTKTLIESIANDIHTSLKRDFINSTVAIDKVTAKKISKYTFMLTSKILFNKYDFIVFNLYLNTEDKIRNKLVITKFTKDI